MTRKVTRRQVLGGALRAGMGLAATGIAGAGLIVAGRSRIATAYDANEKLDLAFIGIGGRGRANLDALAKQNVVALCDVDDATAKDAYTKHPAAKKYYDFRRMLDELGEGLDGVVISTPDHTHFHPAHMAMQMGKHIYLEKPLAHCVHEVRVLTRLAAQKKLATQLGAQRHAMENMHRVVELVQSGAIGDVRECHAWIGGDRGMPGMPKGDETAPAGLEWDLWLGPADQRPYSKTFCPYGWRFWWDFGTGETGNWGCHVLDIPFWALGLGHPERVEGSGPPVHPQMTPKSMATRLDFPARGELPPVALHWYHTTKKDAILGEKDIPPQKDFGTGVLFVGSKGLLLCEFGKRKLFPEERFADFRPPPKTVPDSPGFYTEWVNACKGGEPATCNFDYAGPMAEAVLLANVAYRAGQPFEWDAESLKPKGAPEAEGYLQDTYRTGWKV